jgi:hypothetical protein
MIETVRVNKGFSIGCRLFSEDEIVVISGNTIQHMYMSDDKEGIIVNEIRDFNGLSLGEYTTEVKNHSFKVNTRFQ